MASELLTCEVCLNQFTAKPGAKTCSNKCRVKLSRKNKIQVGTGPVQAKKTALPSVTSVTDVTPVTDNNTSYVTRKDFDIPAIVEEFALQVQLEGWSGFNLRKGKMNPFPFERFLRWFINNKLE